MKIVHTVYSKKSKKKQSKAKSLKNKSKIEIQINITEYTACQQRIKVAYIKTRNRKQQDIKKTDTVASKDDNQHVHT